MKLCGLVETSFGLAQLLRGAVGVCVCVCECMWVGIQK